LGFTKTDQQLFAFNFSKTLQLTINGGCAGARRGCCAAATAAVDALTRGESRATAPPAQHAVWARQLQSREEEAAATLEAVFKHHCHAPADAATRLAHVLNEVRGRERLDLVDFASLTGW
jgi:hypothetical protein